MINLNYKAENSVNLRALKRAEEQKKVQLEL
jgi:hypothetical protein